MFKALQLDNIFGLPYSRRAAILARQKAGAPAWQKWAAACLVAANLVMLASYLVSVNSYAASGYELKKMQSELSTLTEANQKLNVKVAQISSMVTVQSQVLGADFVPAGTPTFLQVNQLTRR